MLSLAVPPFPPCVKWGASQAAGERKGVVHPLKCYRPVSHNPFLAMLSHSTRTILNCDPPPTIEGPGARNQQIFVELGMVGPRNELSSQSQTKLSSSAYNLQEMIGFLSGLVLDPSRLPHSMYINKCFA